jgi:hypothetical protein
MKFYPLKGDRKKERKSRNDEVETWFPVFIYIYGLND